MRASGADAAEMTADRGADGLGVACREGGQDRVVLARTLLRVDTAAAGMSKRWREEEPPTPLDLRLVPCALAGWAGALFV